MEDLLHEHGLSSCILSHRPNVRYVTGFPGDFGHAAFGGNGERILYTSPLYSEQAAASAGNGFIVEEVRDDTFGAMASRGEGFWGGRVGFEADSLTVAEHERLARAFEPRELVPLSGMLDGVRTVKNGVETVAIRSAQRIAESVLAEVIGCLREGVMERDIAAEIDYRFKTRGGEGASFETIVAFGPESSKPHARPGTRKLSTGDIVLFDMGTIVEGYASDMTRTFVFGHADSVFRDRYETVLRAQEAALDGIRSGMSCADADGLARKVIENAGHGERFVHSLGHGVGLEVHEKPVLSSRSKETLETGMVVTVEPGVYFPGWGGIRIEDMAVVTDGGCENLTCFDKQSFEL